MHDFTVLLSQVLYRLGVLGRYMAAFSGGLNQVFHLMHHVVEIIDECCELIVAVIFNVHRHVAIGNLARTVYQIRNTVRKRGVQT